jgi:hypothetical protein
MKTSHGLAGCQVVSRTAFSEDIFPFIFGLEAKGSKQRSLALLCSKVNNICLVFEIW